MPKPLPNVQGSGMHTHLSLWRDEENAFIGDGPYGLSDVALRFVAGLVHHAPEITAITNQWVNSYKRLVPGGRGARGCDVGSLRPRRPGARSFGQARPHRLDACRVPLARSGRQPVPRLRGRCSRRGYAGWNGDYELPKENDPIATLPQSLAEAIDLMANSELLHETLGEHQVEWFLRNKRVEWDSYRGQVTPFELERYLPLL